jgi:hypothetical protein
MAVQLGEIRAQVQGRVLASVGVGSYGTLSEVERFPTGGGTDEISEACIDADLHVAYLVASGSNPLRVGFLLTPSVAHGGVIQAFIGEPESVYVFPPAQAPLGIEAIPGNPIRIQRDRENPQGIPVIPKYHISGSNTVSHNATVANFGVTTMVVTIAALAARSSTLQSPDPFAAAVIALATADIIGKNGGRADSQQAYTQLWESYKRDIQAGGRNLAPMPNPQEMARAA